MKADPAAHALSYQAQYDAASERDEQGTADRIKSGHDNIKVWIPACAGMTEDVRANAQALASRYSAATSLRARFSSQSVPPT